MKPCIGNNPTCPCQDGDMCHYEGPDAWPLPGCPDPEAAKIESEKALRDIAGAAAKTEGE